MRVAPPQPVPDHEDHAADDPSIIDAQDFVRHRKVRFYPAHLHFRQPDQIAHRNAYSRAIESTDRLLSRPFNGSSA
jgi:hypothetical protein